MLERIRIVLVQTYHPGNIGASARAMKTMGLGDLVLVAPATANLMARMAAGMADDLATTLLLATDKRVLIAPAMNVRMWEHPATQRNLATLQGDGVLVAGPDEGAMACGEFGPGRMAEVPDIVAAVAAALSDGPLKGRHVVVTSAGNDNADACTHSGSKYKSRSSFMIGSTTSSDARSSFSNYGSCVDLFAPGSSITAAYYGSNTGLTTMNGTSMASPMVAGVAAALRARYPSANAFQVMQSIVDSASANKLSSINSGSVNKLLYSNTSLSQVYWKPTGQIFNIPAEPDRIQYDTPPSTCTAGQTSSVMLGYSGNPNIGTYFEAWKCQ